MLLNLKKTLLNKLAKFKENLALDSKENVARFKEMLLFKGNAVQFDINCSRHITICLRLEG